MQSTLFNSYFSNSKQLMNFTTLTLHNKYKKKKKYQINLKLHIYKYFVSNCLYISFLLSDTFKNHRD